MKFYVFILITIGLTSFKSFGQDIKVIQQNIDGIEDQIGNIDSQIKFFEVKRDSLSELLSSFKYQKNKLKLEMDLSEGINAKVTFMGGNLREEPKTTSKSIVKIPPGGIVTVYHDYVDSYFKAAYNDLIGYIGYGSLEKNNKLEEIRMSVLKKKNPKLASLTREFGLSNAKRILMGQYWIGMTKDMARASLGSPDHDNRSVGTWGVHNQWIYENVNLYFEDGLLTSWQD